MYTAIYRDFRPDSFEQLVGQDHIVRILKSQIASGQTGHAYLFCGTRGTGKTTTARILAKALNCEAPEASQRPCCECASCRAIREGSFMDVIEIDAASNNGVDNIRELRESVKYPPALGRNKVYIIDEVHMLSAGAFNALLKTLEEPPENVVFILATTEPQKLPATILSRCMRLDFRRVSEPVIMGNMRMICEARGIQAEDAALALIAVNADGSVRDSLSILEQCISTGDTRITRDDVAQMLGTAGEETMISLTDFVMKADISGALLLLDRAIRTGRDVKQFMKEWLAHFRNLLMAKYIQDPENALNMSLENAQRVRAQSAEISTDLLNRGITELTKT
ncbi:MAG: DNA polymerase III subunit gamma/tau, partial [Anaerovoracaceae bacterium]